MVDRNHVMSALDVGQLMIDLLAEYGLNPAELSPLSVRRLRAAFEDMLLKSHGLTKRELNPDWLASRGYFEQPPVCPPIVEQCQRLESYFPGIDLSHVPKLPTPPINLETRARSVLLPKTGFCDRRFNPGKSHSGEIITILSLLAWLNEGEGAVNAALALLERNRLLKPDNSSPLVELESRTPGDVVLLGVDPGYYYAGFPPAYVAAVKNLQSLPLTGTPWAMAYPTLRYALLTGLLAPELMRPSTDKQERHVCCLGTRWQAKCYDNREGHPELEFHNGGTLLHLIDDGKLSSGHPNLGTMTIWVPPLS